MKCWKCDKEMGREDEGLSIKGICVDVTLQTEASPPDSFILTSNLSTPETIAYNNLQLGKYSDGNGECHVSICYECYIDGLLHIAK